MGPITAFLQSLRASLAEWESVPISDLRFSHWDAARLLLLVLGAVSLSALALRWVIEERPGRRGLALPALPPWIRRSPLSFVRHGPLLLFALGLPFFVLAFADPYTSLTRQEVTYPGRRIAFLIDASSSMIAPFKSSVLTVREPAQTAFFTSVATADRFIRLRIQGKYRDLMALVEFGDEAYVVTPFTSDYDNILLSIALVSDFVEFGRFPDKGTKIAQAIEQGVQLFRAFDFLNAEGNLLVIISDGQDSEATSAGKPLDEILQGAVDAKVPIYFIRVGYNRQLGGIIPDDLWKSAVEKTGGRFYAAADEGTILSAIGEIDKRSTGTIAIKQYAMQQPWFSSYALIAVSIWSIALLLSLTVRYFQKFP